AQGGHQGGDSLQAGLRAHPTDAVNIFQGLRDVHNQWCLRGKGDMFFNIERLAVSCNTISQPGQKCKHEGGELQKRIAASKTNPGKIKNKACIFDWALLLYKSCSGTFMKQGGAAVRWQSVNFAARA